MDQIKTRKKAKEIKALDKGVTAGARMKDAYIRSKGKTRRASEPSHDTAKEDAASRMEDMQAEVYGDSSVVVTTVTRKAVKEGKKAIRKHREQKESADEPEAEPQSAGDESRAALPDGNPPEGARDNEPPAPDAAHGETPAPAESAPQAVPEKRGEGRGREAAKERAKVKVKEEKARYAQPLSPAAAPPDKAEALSSLSEPAETPTQKAEHTRQPDKSHTQQKPERTGITPQQEPTGERAATHAAPKKSGEPVSGTGKRAEPPIQAPAKEPTTPASPPQTVKPPRKPQPGPVRTTEHSLQPPQHTNVLPAQRKPVAPKVKTRTIGRSGDKAADEVREAAGKGIRTAAQKAANKTAQKTGRKAAAEARKAFASTLKAAGKAVVEAAKGAAEAIGALVGGLGGGAVLAIVAVIVLIAALASSPFGLFFAGGDSGSVSTVSVAEAVAQVNQAYNDALENLQTDTYDSIDVTGAAPEWPEVLAVFAARYAGAEDGVDVATLDADRVDKLTDVFWDMTAVDSVEETVDHPDSDPDDGIDDGWTERILHITVTAKTAGEMETAYGFTDYQKDAMAELLSDRAALSALAESLDITNREVLEILNALPDDLSPDRRRAVETALSLVGKVGYFWGGKSHTTGWDSRWGQLTKVTAAGSPTTGKYRPYGLDCSGFLDWTLRNAGLPSDGHWYIGTNLTPITQAAAQPGDMALYPDASHIGMVVGRNAAGKLLICHCSSGSNCVVVTEFAASGFTVLGRPGIYTV